MTLRAYLFDLDGTLVNSLPDLAAAVDLMLQSYQLPALGESRVAALVGNGSRVLVERALQQSQWCGAPAHSPELLNEAHERFLHFYQREFLQRSHLYAGVSDTLQRLQKRGALLAIVTNKPSRFIQPLLSHLQIAEFFSLCLGGDSLPEKKPHPLPLLTICDQWRVAVADCLMVGDSRNDIDAARAAGMRVAAVSFGYNHGQPVTQHSPDYVLDYFADLLSIT